MAIRNHKHSAILLSLWIGLTLVTSTTQADDTFTPYAAGEVPQNVSDLWKNYDARKEPLDTRVVKEWKADGVVTRYVTFKVGTFKGTDARIAAYYSFPENAKQKNAAFVWSHGGGQRAERGRGVYFAKQGFATVDINWLGRTMEPEIDENTDWGKVDPTQGPRFYSKALRDGWKRNLQPDEYAIDPVTSPRNANWFLLTVAARRAITFLEQQPEVDADRIGFSGFSMGGMITALTAIDSRLRAAAPFVGGSGFKYVDFPGIEGSSIRQHFQDLELYKTTIDASAYWPLVTCPVMFISSSNDFHATFERIYQSMALLPHNNWRVTTNIHQNHGPGPEQWVMLNQWFNQYLKGTDQNIPVTPPSTFHVDGDRATFTVTPANQRRLVATEIYFSYDPNSRTRFWNRANAERSDQSWAVELPVYEQLPLYVFALCRYRLPQTVPLERGETATFVLNSVEQSIVPQSVDLNAMAKLPKTGAVFEDFHHGMRDWATRDQRSIKTYKFQSPDLERSNSKKLSLTIDPQNQRLALRLNAGSNFLSRQDNLGDFTYVKNLSGKGLQDVLVRREDFTSTSGKTLEWSKIATFEITLVDQDTKARLDLTSAEGHAVMQTIRLVD